jgi:uncharacterized protein
LKEGMVDPMGFSLLPKETRFYALLNEMAEYAARASALLNDLFATPQLEEKHRLAAEIRKLKRQAKESMIETTERLCLTFITPIDREDLQAVMFSLYKIPKSIDKIATRVLAYKMETLNQDFPRFGQNIANISVPIQQLVKGLEEKRDLTWVKEKYELVHSIESAQDDLMAELLQTLYHGDTDFKQLLFRKDLYAILEKVTDRHRDVANTLLQVVLKLS